MDQILTQLDPGSGIFKRIMDALYDGVYCTNRDRRICYWNPSAERLCGFTAEEVVGKYCHDDILQHVDVAGRSLCMGHCPLAKTMETGVNAEAQVYLHHKEGHRLPVSVRTSQLIDAEGNVIGGIEVFSDASEMLGLKGQHEKMRQLALIDQLTDIPNRRYADQMIEQALAQHHRYQHPFGLILFDIDHFKKVNDERGHAVGDRALGMVARSLQMTCRSGDFIARWGGEEFVALIRNVTPDQLRETAERYRILVKTSFLAHDHFKLTVTVSAGATLAQDNDTAATLVGRADKYMYASKSQGRNRITDDQDVGL